MVCAMKCGVAPAQPTYEHPSISDMNYIPVGQKKWMETEAQESIDPYCFQVSKFITRLLRHCQKVHREDDGAVHYDQVIDECKKEPFDNIAYRSVERKNFVNAPHWSIEQWI